MPEQGHVAGAICRSRLPMPIGRGRLFAFIGPTMASEGGFCNLGRELTAICIFTILGFGFLVPGFMLRLEDVRISTSLRNPNWMPLDFFEKKKLLSVLSPLGRPIPPLPSLLSTYALILTMRVLTLARRPSAQPTQRRAVRRRWTCTLSCSSMASATYQQ